MIASPQLKQQAAKTLLQRKAQREHMIDFFLAAFPIVDPGAQLKMNWHIEYICEYLEACWEREIKKLILNIPPRFMKSNLCTVSFPAWGLGKDPAEKFMCASYSGKLSVKHSVDSRLIVESPWFKTLFPETRIAKDQNAKEKFQTTKRGHRIATSVGGSATGDGGNFLIQDDPINPRMAMSEAERNTANEWIDQTWSTRKNDPKTAVEIIVMQRLHVKDPTGKMLSEDDGWTQVVIPQEAEISQIITYPRTGKIITRREGELLHTDRVGPDEVKSFKKRLGSYGYSSQQQQRPSPKGGGIIKLEWFNRYDVAPERKEHHSLRISLDTANKDKEINDPSVAEVWLTTDAGHYLVDVWKDRVVYPDLKRKVINLLEKWRPNECIIEDKASGQQLIQDLKRETYWNIIPIDPTGQGDKVVRMSNESPAIEAGNCWLPNKAPWLFDFETEVENFPNSEHFDQVDSLSQFLRKMRQPEEIFVW